MAELDLDAVKAAKAEAKKAPHKLKLRGVSFEVPGHCPGWLLHVLIEGQLAQTQAEQVQLGIDVFRHLKEVVGSDKWTELLHAGFDESDFEVLFQGVASVYGFQAGESKASRGSSSNGGRRVRPTSNGSTGSTSRKRSGAKRPSGLPRAVS